MTRLGPPPSDLPPPPSPAEPGGPGRRLWWFAGAAVLIVLTGLVVVVAARPGMSRRPEAPTDARPPLARACPPPSDVPGGTAAPSPAVPTPAPAPTGMRTVDETTGISYPSYGPPWETWNTVRLHEGCARLHGPIIA